MIVDIFAMNVDVFTFEVDSVGNVDIYEILADIVSLPKLRRK